MNLKPVGRVLKSTGQFIVYFRKVFLAIPVVVAAFLVARYAAAQLPEEVGLILARDGSFSVMIARRRFIQCSMLLTGGSLVLMAFSRKTFYPWLISVVTLVVPYLVVLLNQLF